MTAGRNLLGRTLVWDNHACLPLRPGEPDPLAPLLRHRAIGVDMVSVNVGFGEVDLAIHLKMLASIREAVRARPDDFLLICTADDVERARVTGRLGIVFDVEGMAPLDGGDHGLVRLFYQLGVRWMLVAYNRANTAGGGCLDAEDVGLTAHGRAILDEMRAVGMVVCCSHTGERTARDVFANAGAPVIFSHSNAAALDPHPRNISDDLARACAATGGVVGVNGLAAFLGECADLTDAVVRHVDHLVQTIGIAHVGLALDYVFDRAELQAFLDTMRVSFPDDRTFDAPFRQVEIEDLPDVAEGLARLGYGERDLASLLGGNWLRVARQVWK